MGVCFAYFFTTTAMLSVVFGGGGKCGYVPGPLAATDDTFVIKLDCSQATPSSHDSQPLQLRDDVTHVAVQLTNCRTVPAGLFTNVTHHLTSVTVASQDAVQLLQGTFEGLQQVTEFRLLGFAALKNLSTSVLEPLRNIRTLILDGLGSTNIELPHIGSVIRKLSGTPISRLVLNRIKDRLFFQQIMHIDDFKISNASVKELVITNAPINCEGSIRRAFPDLVCFCEGGNFDEQTAETLPALYDLIFLSDHLKELVLHRTMDLPALPLARRKKYSKPLGKLLLSIFKAVHLYPDLLQYYLSRSHSENCELGVILKIGANLSKLTANGIPVFIKAKKPICIDENNNLTYLDLTESYIRSTFLVFKGLKKLEYLSLENTGIVKFPNTYLQYYPSLKVLKLSSLDIGDFVESSDGDFFGSCPTLSDIHLDNCNITKIPTTIFSRSANLQHLDVSKNYLSTFDFDLGNCTRLNVLNFSHNNIGSVTRKSIVQLTRLALRKTRSDNLLVDLSYNRLHCLCNSTNFVRWLQRLPTASNITFAGYDSYACLYPNGSNVQVSEVSVDELEQQCIVIKTLANGSACPCDEEPKRNLQQVRMHLDGFFCRNDAGELVAMKKQPLPSCFNAYLRASFIAPVVIGGLSVIALLIAVVLLIYYRNSKPVRQVRECLAMNPVRFVRVALQYVMMHNREEEQAMFRHDMFVFVQDDDQSSVHGHFTRALERDRSLITRDDFLPGAAVVDALVECIRVCQWIVPVMTSNFLSDHVCVDFVSRAQFSRPHALIPVVWEQPLDLTDISAGLEDLLRTGDPLYWPGDQASAEERRSFWSSLIERTT